MNFGKIDFPPQGKRRKDGDDLPGGKRDRGGRAHPVPKGGLDGLYAELAAITEHSEKVGKQRPEATPEGHTVSDRTTEKIITPGIGEGQQMLRQISQTKKAPPTRPVVARKTGKKNLFSGRQTFPDDSLKELYDEDGYPAAAPARTVRRVPTLGSDAPKPAYDTPQQSLADIEIPGLTRVETDPEKLKIRSDADGANEFFNDLDKQNRPPRKRPEQVPMNDGPFIQVETKLPNAGTDNDVYQIPADEWANAHQEVSGQTPAIDTSDIADLDFNHDMQAWEIPGQHDADIQPPLPAVEIPQEGASDVAEIRRNRRDGAGRMATQEEIDAMNAELAAKGLAGEPEKADTRRGWFKKMGDIIKQFPERVTGSERFEKSKTYLDGRLKELGEKAKEYKGNPEQLIRDMGERYNKLSFMKKVLIGAGLTAGTATFAGVSSLLTGGFAAGLVAQRAYGFASTYLLTEKFILKMEGRNKNGPPQKSSKLDMAVNALTALAWSMVVSGTVAAAAVELSESAAGQWVHEFLKSHYPFAEARVAAPSAASTPEASPVATPQANISTEAATLSPESMEALSKYGIHAGSSTEEIQTALAKAQEDLASAHTDVGAASEALEKARTAVAEASGTAPAAAELSVEASKGHGYEWMMKRLVEQAHENGITADRYEAGSDMRRLLEASPKELNDVLHDLAKENGFVNKDGMSVQINLGDHMRADAQGYIFRNDDMFAPEGAKVTPAYHPEAPAPETSPTTSPRVGIENPSSTHDVAQPGDSVMARDDREMNPVNAAPTLESNVPPPPPLEASVGAGDQAPEVPAVTPEAQVAFTQIDHTPIDPKAPAVYEVQDKATGAKYLFAYGGTDEARYAFVQKHLAIPGNEDHVIRYGHEVKSLIGSRFQIDEIGMQKNQGSSSSWFFNFFKSSTPPSPETFLKRVSP